MTNLAKHDSQDTLPAARRKNIAARRTRILEEAAQIISEKGANGLTMRNLAAASQVTVPTIYNLWGNRDDILVALSQKIQDVLGEALRKGDGQHPLGQMGAMVDGLRDALVRDDAPFLHGAACAFIAQADQPEYRHYAAEIIADIAAICRAQHRVQLRGNIDAELLAIHIWLSLEQGLAQWSRGALSTSQTMDFIRQGIFLALSADAMPGIKGRFIGQISAA